MVRIIGVTLAIALCLVSSAFADVRDYLGRPLVDVRVEVGGVLYTEASVLELIETRVGEPLSMERVRESIDHLVGLGRFEDVRVFADASDTRPGGVTLRWVLVPVQRIAEIEFAGNPGVSRNSLRAEITERVGSLPVTSRVPEIEEAVRTFYAERGYRQPVCVAPNGVDGRQEPLQRLLPRTIEVV